MTAWKLVVSYLLVVISLFVTPLSALAISPNEPTSSTSATTNYELRTTNSLPTTVSPTSTLYTDLLVNNLFHTFSCLAVGQSFIGQPCLTYQLTKNAEGMIQGVPVLSQTNLSGGTMGAITSVIGMLYTNPPIRTADYLASVGSGLGLVKEAHAQTVGGSGEAILHPVLTLWQVSRNISYVILIIIFLVIGLMVMFRSKLNPQTVITAQAALPGLVIGLILITFSYFLAGLLSDMAFVGTNLVGYYFSAAQGNAAHPQDLVRDATQQNILSLMSPFTGIIGKDEGADIIGNLWLAMNDSTRNILTLVASFISAQTTMQFTEGLKLIPVWGIPAQLALSGITTAITGANTPAVLGFAIVFVATAILIYAMFKLLVRLISNYITIIFLTMTAPFQLLIAALPGRQGMATNWMLNMLANVLAFPAVLAGLYLAAFLLPKTILRNNCPAASCVFQISQTDQTQNSLVPTAQAGTTEPTLVNTQAFPLFGGMNLNFINILLAFGILMALPSIPDIIGRTIGKMGAASQLLGQEISGAAGRGQGYGSQLQRGIAGFSGQAATARGLFSTPGYKMRVIPGTGENGENPQYEIVKTYEAGRGATFGALTRAGVTKPPKLESGVSE